PPTQARMVESNSILSTAATNITLSDTNTGATNLSVDRDIPLIPPRSLRAYFIVSLTLGVYELARSLAFRGAPNRERIRGSRGHGFMELAIISRPAREVNLACIVRH